ncbi:MAG: hypothetical protein RL701_280 [Pseudomonadota bacterium]
MTRERRDDADQLCAEHDGITHESDHALAARPGLIADARIAHDLIRDVGRTLRRDLADLELPHGNAPMRAVDVRIQTRTRLQFEVRTGGVERPDARERGVDVLNHGARAGVERVSRGPCARKHGPNLGLQRQKAVLLA